MKSLFPSTTPCLIRTMRERSVIQEVENINETITSCQACCQETSGCREFHFNTLSQRCTLSSSQYPTCNVRIGPASPLVDECMIDPVGCSAFMDEDCEYKNEAENILGHLADPRSCQMFMNELGPDFGGGNYLIFQKNPQREMRDAAVWEKILFKYLWTSVS